MSLSTWVLERKSSLLSIGLGSVSWVVAIAVGWQLWPAGPVLSSPSERLAYAAQLLVGVSVVVLLMIAACFRVFDTPRAEDPFADAESAGWRVHQRVLQNTVEQSLVFIPALTALAVRVEAAHSKILPLLTASWCAGRLLFWLGYRIRPSLRGPGFEWTLYSSLTALVWLAATR